MNMRRGPKQDRRTTQYRSAIRRDASALLFCLLAASSTYAAQALTANDTTYGAAPKTNSSENLIAENRTDAASGDAIKLLNQGKKLLSDGRSQEAEPLLKNAVIADESNAECHLNYGICLYNLDRYWGALSQLEKALELDKNNPQAYLYLGHCYSKTRKISDAVRCYENYMETTSSRDDAEKYRALVGALKTQVISTQNAASVATGTVSGDYMKETTVNGIFRWPESRMPITVFIEPVGSVSGYRPEFDDVLRHAFQEWTTATKSKARFEVVNKRDGAAMIVTWTDDMHAPELKAEAGKASVLQDSDGIKSADLKLLTVSPFKEGPLGSQALYLVCLHEIGHSLGLLGHSPYTDDIMYPILSEQSGITPRDIRTFEAVYSAADESLAVASGDNKAASDNEFSRLTPANQAALLIKIGTKAVFAGKYAESITSFEKALKLDSSNALAKSNLAVAANNLSLQVQSNEEKFTLLHKALYWNPDSQSARTNLAMLLSTMNISADDPDARIKLADKLERENDLVGASVELAESVRLKPNAKVSARLEAMRKKLGS